LHKAISFFRPIGAGNCYVAQFPFLLFLFYLFSQEHAQQPMGQKRKGRSGGELRSKEVEFVAVKTARLGTRMKAKRVRRGSSPSPEKFSTPKGSQTPSGRFLSSSHSQDDGGPDYDLPLFDDQPSFALGSVSETSTKKKTGKVECRYL
jgi:hypothetical protein